MSNTTTPAVTVPAGYALGSWWYYAPNKAAPIVFAFLFAASGAVHVWQCKKYHSWKASAFLPFAALIFVGGYVMRAVGAWHYDNLNIFISSTIMLLAAPPVYEAANFFTLGRILYYVPSHSPIHPGRVVTTFGALQMIVETLNGNGGSRVANSAITPEEQDIGKILLKTALILQLFCMLAFILLATRFEYNCRQALQFPANLRMVLRVLYISCALITIRTIYRTVEWFEDIGITTTDPSTFPPVLRQEWFFWVFESTLMILNTWILNIFHPSHYLPANLKIYLAPDGVTEMEGMGFQDRRIFWRTVFDPFDVWSLIKGRKTNIWEQQHQAGADPKKDGTEMGSIGEYYSKTKLVEEV